MLWSLVHLHECSLFFLSCSCKYYTYVIDMQQKKWNRIGRDLSLSNGNWLHHIFIFDAANKENNFYNESWTIGMCVRRSMSLNVLHYKSRHACLNIEFINHNQMHRCVWSHQWKNSRCVLVKRVFWPFVALLNNPLSYDLYSLWWLGLHSGILQDSPWVMWDLWYIESTINKNSKGGNRCQDSTQRDSG